MGEGNSGPVVASGRVFLLTKVPDKIEEEVAAYDAKSGKELWRTNVEDSQIFGCRIDGAPLVVKDLVVVGSTGGDSAHRGHLVQGAILAALAARRADGVVDECVGHMCLLNSRALTAIPAVTPSGARGLEGHRKGPSLRSG